MSLIVPFLLDKQDEGIDTDYLIDITSQFSTSDEEVTINHVYLYKFGDLRCMRFDITLAAGSYSLGDQLMISGGDYDCYAPSECYSKTTTYEFIWGGYTMNTFFVRFLRNYTLSVDEPISIVTPMYLNWNSVYPS